MAFPTCKTHLVPVPGQHGFMCLNRASGALAQGPSSGRVESAKPLKLARHDSAGMASSASGPRRLFHGPGHRPGRVDG